MPTLHWIGKDKVVNHHLEVPYRILQKQYTFGDVEKSENKIIHGDNLDALKSLLPEYEGKVKCIYIDPPYNTGNEGWIYNDNVSDPKLKKWLHQVVGKEGEDLTRHDKWLCMMYPRLKLLQKLLTDDGAIFVSIDDNEQTNLKIIMDEIFGNNNFIGSLIWQKRKGGGNDSFYLGVDHEYIVAYVKDHKYQENKWRVTYEEDYLKRYKFIDEDGRYYWDTLSRPGLNNPIIYDVKCPDGTVIKDGTWQVSQDTFNDGVKNGTIKLSQNKNGEWSAYRKVYMPKDGKVFRSVINDITNKDAADQMESIFGNKKEFSTPKPVQLIEKVIELSTNPGDIILDSFAGSGTTAHAVFNLNAKYPEEKKRNFILIETEQYAETITAERVKRVIKGYGKTEGTGGDFEYLTLGSPLMTEDGLLSSDASLEDIRSYICYTETGSHILDTPLVDHPYWLARSEDRDHYFYFERENITVLDRDFLSTITVGQPYYTIWADQCYLSASFMKKEGITFRKIPRDIRNI